MNARHLIALTIMGAFLSGFTVMGIVLRGAHLSTSRLFAIAVLIMAAACMTALSATVLCRQYAL